MKVIVSCGGKFHAFNLAEQLDKKGYLKKLITSYYSQKCFFLPKFRIDKEMIAPCLVTTNILPQVLLRGLSKFLKTQDQLNLNFLFAEMFDRWVVSQIEKCDLFVGWSGHSLHSLRKAKSLGAVTVLERGSSHIQFQKEILEEEYKKFNCNIEPVNESILQKELLEYSEADYVSLPSGFVKETFLQRGFNQNKLIHIPYGVDLSNFKPIPKQDDKFRIVYLGTLSLRKGVQYLLQAYSELNLPNSELCLIGAISPEVKDILKEYEGNFSYLGFVSHLDLYKYLSQGSIFVLPSIEEGLACVILQAMACGLPIICTTNTGGADIIREGKEGFVIPIRDVNILKEKILYLYEHQSEREYMSKLAFQRAKEFTWDAYGEKMIKAYKNILLKDY